MRKIKMDFLVMASASLRLCTVSLTIFEIWHFYQSFSECRCGMHGSERVNDLVAFWSCVAPYQTPAACWVSSPMQEWHVHPSHLALLTPGSPGRVGVAGGAALPELAGYPL